MRERSARKVTLEAGIARLEPGGELAGCDDALVIVTELQGRWALWRRAPPASRGPPPLIADVVPAMRLQCPENMKGTMRRCLGVIGAWFLARAGAAGAYGAGLRYLERGDVAAAAEAFADAQRLWARELGPWYGGVVLAMAKRAACYVRLGHVREGVQLYERAIALDRGLRGDATDRVRLLAAELAQARMLLPASFEGEGRGALEPVGLP